VITKDLYDASIQRDSEGNLIAFGDVRVIPDASQAGYKMMKCNLYRLDSKESAKEN
jgi:hypothetical protein